MIDDSAKVGAVMRVAQTIYQMSHELSMRKSSGQPSVAPDGKALGSWHPNHIRRRYIYRPNAHFVDNCMSGNFIDKSAELLPP